MEVGVYMGSAEGSLPQIDFRLALIKGNSGNHFSVKTGDAQRSESLMTLYEGPRPPGYEIMQKQGAIVLGIGGDNSPWASGTFYEGAMTAGYASNETDAAVMANVVAAGYARRAEKERGTPVEA